MTAEPRVTWDIGRTNFLKFGGLNQLGKDIFGDRGYLFYIDVLEEQISLFPASIKTFRVLVREQNKRKDTSEYVFSIDRSHHDIEYTKEMILKETKRKVKANNIEPLDFYK